MSDEGGKKWYVLRALSGKEMKVKETIEAACRNNAHLGQYISKVLVPTEKVVTTRNGKKVPKDRILLSGYVFVECELKGDVESFLENTSNVTKFVRSHDNGKRPVPAKEEEMLRMIGAAESASEQLTESVDDFVVGEKVKVTYGPFNGFDGDVADVNRDRHELTVIVTVFGREVRLTLDNSQVERV